MKRMIRLLFAVAMSCGVAFGADDAPIGVFDSGLGGLTVLERMLDVDRVNNATGEIINLDSTMKYALRHGSLSAPVVLSGAEVTGIMETMADAQQSADENIYDLSGRRVDKMQKGIYIVNGKKVLVK